MRHLRSLKICYLAGTLGQGGAERQLFYALRALRLNGATPRVLCLDQGAFWEEPIKQLGVAVTWLGQHRSRLKRLCRIVKELKQDPPDIFQSQHFYTNAYVRLAALPFHCAAIGALRSNGVFDLRESGRIGGQLNLRLPKILVANSESAIRYARSRGLSQSRLFFLSNVVDTERFKPGPCGFANPTTLLAVGRLTREKRFDRFLSILHSLRQEHGLNVRGLIVGATRGDQDLRPQLEQQAEALGLLPDGVEFRGSIADMPSIYQQAAVCVLTSDHEGTPNVLLEAMACGLPVVATKVGGVPEIVQHGVTGFLLPPENVAGQVSAIFDLVRKPELRIEMGNRARASVQSTHSVDGLAGRLNALYHFARCKSLENLGGGSVSKGDRKLDSMPALQEIAARLPH